MDKTKLEQILIDILQKTVNGIDEGVDFFRAELPDVVNQLLLWHSVKSAIGCFIGITLLAVSFIIAIKAIKHYNIKKKDYKGNDFDISNDAVLSFFAAIALIPTVMTGLLLTFLNYEWIQILIAPKIFLIDYALELIK